MTTRTQRNLAVTAFKYENARLHTEPTCERVTVVRPAWYETAEGEAVRIRRQIDVMYVTECRFVCGVQVTRTARAWVVFGVVYADSMAAARRIREHAEGIAA
jgi:hypothetical protein